MNDQEYLVRKIRTQYTEKEHTALDELRRLDSEVKRPANVFGYVFGTIAALVMGAGMSLVMTDIGKMLGLSRGAVNTRLSRLRQELKKQLEKVRRMLDEAGIDYT